MRKQLRMNNNSLKLKRSGYTTQQIDYWDNELSHEVHCLINWYSTVIIAYSFSSDHQDKESIQTRSRAISTFIHNSFSSPSPHSPTPIVVSKKQRKSLLVIQIGFIEYDSDSTHFSSFLSKYFIICDRGFVVYVFMYYSLFISLWYLRIKELINHITTILLQHVLRVVMDLCKREWSTE